MKIRIRRRCKCGCGRITNYRKNYIHGHHRRLKQPIKKIRRRCQCGCGGITNYGRTYIIHHNPITKETRRKMAHSMIGNIHGKGGKGRKHTKETKLKMSLSAKKLSKEIIFKRSISQLKCNPNYKYCDAWKDREYTKSLRKDYCENKDCENDYRHLNNHHINLNKKDCRPANIITLCASCHMVLHAKLYKDPKHYIIINRPNHISYINKKTHKTTKIERTMHDKPYLV